MKYQAEKMARFLLYIRLIIEIHQFLIKKMVISRADHFFD